MVKKLVYFNDQAVLPSEKMRRVDDVDFAGYMAAPCPSLPNHSFLSVHENIENFVF